jgi:exosortase E/protease (VPEID-CTERM system)
MTELPLPAPRSFPRLLLALIAAEIVVVALTFQFAVDFDCRAARAYGACMALRNSLGRGLALLAVVVLVPAVRGCLLALPPRPRPMPWPLVHLAGVALILAPALAPASADFARTFRASLPLWISGAGLAGLGALFWLAPPAAWARLLRPACLAPIAAALAAPEILGLADRLWGGAALSDLTFAAVARGLAPFGAVAVYPAERIVRLDGFAVEVAGPCSGMEGFALITALLAAHLWIERAHLRWPHALALLPLALAASFVLNALRIGGLVLVGARISPELAVNGFHSHAGWLAFTLLAFALIGLTRLPVLRGAPRAERAAEDSAALILPFVATMLAGLGLATFTADPSDWYPLRAAVTLAALLPFAATWARLGAPSATSIGAGLAVGLAWLVTAPAATSGPAWIALAGAVLLTPLAEEAFFRGYLQPRLVRAGLPRPVALIVAAGLFGLLHDRWLAGALAGAAFGLAGLHRGRLTDAIAAHAAANATLAIWALAMSRPPGF